MPTWPPSLQQNADAGSYEESYVDNAIRSPMSIGSKRRLRDTVVVKTYKISLTVDAAQKQALYAFWKDTLEQGTISFDWIRFDGTEPRSYYMLTDPEFSATGPQTWRAAFSLIDAV